MSGRHAREIAVMAAMLALGCAAGCAGRRSAARQAEIQRDIQYWEANRVARDPRVRPRDPTRPYTSPPHLSAEPRVVCIDGTLSLSCIGGRSYERCCDYQGGVYYDPWGNVVLSR